MNKFEFENNQYPARKSADEIEKIEQTPKQNELKKEEVEQNSAPIKEPQTENSIEKGDFIPHYLLESAE